MELTKVLAGVVSESNQEFSELPIQQLQDFDLCLVGGGMGDVQQ